MYFSYGDGDGSASQADDRIVFPQDHYISHHGDVLCILYLLRRAVSDVAGAGALDRVQVRSGKEADALECFCETPSLSQYRAQYHAI